MTKTSPTKVAAKRNPKRTFFLILYCWRKSIAVFGQNIFKGSKVLKHHSCAPHYCRQRIVRNVYGDFKLALQEVCKSPDERPTTNQTNATGHDIGKHFRWRNFQNLFH